MRPRSFHVPRGSTRAARPAFAVAVPIAIAALASGIAGCGAIRQDVHEYYRQMARNYHEAEEKAKLDALALETASRQHLEAGHVHKFQRDRREIDRLKDWQARCAHQKERFEQAARKLEPAPQVTTKGAPTEKTGRATTEYTENTERKREE